MLVNIRTGGGKHPGRERRALRLIRQPRAGEHTYRGPSLWLYALGAPVPEGLIRVCETAYPGGVGGLSVNQVAAKTSRRQRRSIGLCTPQRDREHGHSVFCPFPVPHQDLVKAEVDVLDPVRTSAWH